MEKLKKRFSSINTDKKNYLYSIIGLIIIIIVVFCELLSSETVLNASDTLTQDYFWHVFFKRQLHDSPSFLTWNPYINSGTFFFGGLHLIFIPISLVCDLILLPHMSITVSGLAHLFLAGIFTLLYARLIGLGFIASFFSALFFIMSAQLVSLFNAGHVNKLNTISYLPVVLFFLERAINRRRFFDFTLVSVALSLQLYEGHLQISFYTCLVVAIYFIWRSIHKYKSEKNVKSFSRLYGYASIMTLLFFLLSAASFSWWLEFKEQSERKEGMSYELATNWSMSKKELLTYIVPQFFGLSRPNYKDPGKIEVFYWNKDLPFTQTADYLGLLPLILTIAALFKYRERYVKIFFIMALVFQILAMGRYTPIYPFFYHYMGFKYFRVPKMMLFITAFSVAIMAGYGIQWLLGDLDKKDKGFLKKLIYSILGFSGILFLMALYAEVNQNSLVQQFLPYLRGYGRSLNPTLVIPRYEYALDGMWLACILLLICSGLLALRFIKKIRLEIFALFLLGFFLADITILNSKFINGVSVKDNVFIEKDTAIDYFEKDKSTYRVFNAIRNWWKDEYLSYRITNKYMLYEKESVTGYEAVQMTRYNNYMNMMNLNNNLIDLLNVKYIVLGKEDLNGKRGDRIGKYEIVVDKDVKILKNLNTLPRAFPVHRARVLKDKNLILNWLASPNFDPSRVVLLEAPFEGTLSASTRSETESEAVITLYKNDRINLDAKMVENGFIVLSEKYYPGWNAYLDGVPTKIHLADYALRAIYVPKGEHRIEFRYEPISNRLALYITFISFSFVFVVVAWQCLNLYRQKKQYS